MVQRKKYVFGNFEIQKKCDKSKQKSLKKKTYRPYLYCTRLEYIYFKLFRLSEICFVIRLNQIGYQSHFC